MTETGRDLPREALMLIAAAGMAGFRAGATMRLQLEEWRVRFRTLGLSDAQIDERIASALETARTSERTFADAMDRIYQALAAGPQAEGKG